MSVPNWWAATLLAAAAYRVWRLLMWDTLTEKPRTRVLQRLSVFWKDFLFCGFCFGAWIAGVWWLAWILWPHAALVAATPFALSLAVGLIGSRVDTE